MFDYTTPERRGIACDCGPNDGCQFCTLREGEAPLRLTRAGLDRVKGEASAKIFDSQTGFLLGKVLTVIDASIVNTQQCKAVKDLIKDKFHEQKRHVCSLTTGAQLVSGPNGEVEV